jgi:ATP-dependent phosphoenolpyruvate carboxykinase
MPCRGRAEQRQVFPLFDRQGPGVLIRLSGKGKGCSPKVNLDKRIVFEETSKDDIWWV